VKAPIISARNQLEPVTNISLHVETKQMIISHSDFRKGCNLIYLAYSSVD